MLKKIILALVSLSTCSSFAVNVRSSLQGGVCEYTINITNITQGCEFTWKSYPDIAVIKKPRVSFQNGGRLEISCSSTESAEINFRIIKIDGRLCETYADISGVRGDRYSETKLFNPYTLKINTGGYYSGDFLISLNDSTLPDGSYKNTCETPSLSNGIYTASCLTGKNQERITTSIDYHGLCESDELDNLNGYLKCHDQTRIKMIPAGSWLDSCAISAYDLAKSPTGGITVYCATYNKKMNKQYIDLGTYNNQKLSNNNGKLHKY